MPAGHRDRRGPRRIRVATTPAAFERCFSGSERLRIAVEAGTHSPWIGRVVRGCSHEVLVANARRLRLIHVEGRKNDRLDAENLARLARLDPRLLSPIEHRGEASQAHPAIVRSREALVEARTKLVNHVRGAVKSFGSRLPGCNAEGFHRKVRDHVPEALAPALEPFLETIASLTARIREYDRELEAVSRELYPQTALLRRVPEVGPITALSFVLVLENPSRFEASRSVGAYLSLIPGTGQYGDCSTNSFVERPRRVRRSFPGAVTSVACSRLAAWTRAFTAERRITPKAPSFGPANGWLRPIRGIARNHL